MKDCCPRQGNISGVRLGNKQHLDLPWYLAYAVSFSEHAWNALIFLRMYLALPCNNNVITVHSHPNIIPFGGVASWTDRKIKIFLITNDFENH